MRRLLLIFALALAGCFNPEIEDGGFLCARTRQCPGGFRCVAEGSLKVCRKEGSGPFDARLADAHPDARGEARRDLPVTDLAADRGLGEASADRGGREASPDRALLEASPDRGREQSAPPYAAFRGAHHALSGESCQDVAEAAGSAARWRATRAELQRALAEPDALG